MEAPETGSNQIVGHFDQSITAETMKTWAIERLRSFFADCMTRAASDIYYGALAWAELKRRGEEMPVFDSKLAKFLPSIASRELAAEVVVKHPDAWLLDSMRGLPISEQKRLAEGGTVPVVKDLAGTTVQVTLGELAKERALSRRVFKFGRVVPVEEQAASIRRPELKTKAKEQPKAETKSKPVQVVRVEDGQGPYRPIDADDINAAKVVSEVIRFYPGEAENLKSHADAVKMTVAEFVRMVVHHGGYLKRRGKK